MSDRFTKEFDFVEQNFFKAAGFKDQKFYFDIMENFLSYFIQQGNNGHLLNIVRMLEDKVKLNPTVMIRFLTTTLVLSTMTNFTRSNEILSQLSEDERKEVLKTVAEEAGMINKNL